MKNIRYSMLCVLFAALALMSFGACKSDDSPKFPDEPTYDMSGFAKGADVSWLTEMENSSVLFYDSLGRQKECMHLLRELGMNTIRLRVWVNPKDGWCNAGDVLAKAIRAQNLGFRLLIDFHYSDSWADPSQQTKPAAWDGLSFDSLKIAMSNHTQAVLEKLKDKNIDVEWVQVGNETRDGMLWEDGRASSSMQNFADLVNTGYSAVKNVYPSAKVIVHLDNGYDNNLYRWMFDGLTKYKAKYDVIGMSLYPDSTNWKTYNEKCLANMNDMVSRYGKEVMLCEVGFAASDAANSYKFLTDIISKAKSVTDSKCLGVIYWEPQAYNSWKAYKLGAFDDNGKPTIALNAFKNN
ncbi:MAG: glycosyl hydrolase 53 family protein [Dysgonamonadaceae bacterium]